MQQSEATGLPYLDLSSEIIQVRGQRLDSTLLHLEAKETRVANEDINLH